MNRKEQNARWKFINKTTIVVWPVQPIYIAGVMVVTAEQNKQRFKHAYKTMIENTGKLN